MLLSPRMTSIPATSPLGYQNPSLLRVTLRWEFTQDANIFMFFTHSERTVDIPFLQMLSHQFSSHVPFKSLIIQPNHCPLGHESVYNLCLIISPFKPGEHPGGTLLNTSWHSKKINSRWTVDQNMKEKINFFENNKDIIFTSSGLRNRTQNIKQK